ncbi:NUDIX domain-containing protein [Sphingomonas bacterium]|uniref:NUDIX hydrolase n=1 Tax=Sphingomonas bacterium TaxID=1895847 RepID=UPI00157542F9|nr:NUDIX domain-containing protein [Sphingomonas bacterium]
MTDLPDAIPAATLIVMRDRVDGPADLLMVERAKAMRFAAGALVFPGGRIDPGDDVLAATIGDGDDLAARVAAIRETIEEAGLAIGLSPTPSAASLASIRAALHAGEPFADVLAAAGIALDPGVLVPFARWRPAHRHARIFDTRFYLAALPDGSPEPTADEGETARLFWSSAAAVLASADAGRAILIYPTRRNLERLAQHRHFAAAVVDAAAHPIQAITPFIERRPDGDRLCIPQGLGYPVTSEPLSSATRG